MVVVKLFQNIPQGGYSSMNRLPCQANIYSPISLQMSGEDENMGCLGVFQFRGKFLLHSGGSQPELVEAYYRK